MSDEYTFSQFKKSMTMTNQEGSSNVIKDRIKFFEEKCSTTKNQRLSNATQKSSNQGKNKGMTELKNCPFGVNSITDTKTGELDDNSKSKPEPKVQHISKSEVDQIKLPTNISSIETECKNKANSKIKPSPDNGRKFPIETQDKSTVQYQKSYSSETNINPPPETEKFFSSSQNIKPPVQFNDNNPIDSKNRLVFTQNQNKSNIISNENNPTNQQNKLLKSLNTISYTNTSTPNTEIDEPIAVSSLSQQTSTVKEETFLSSVELPIEIANESFCEGFFIASAPKENGKVVENSQGFISSCGHAVCSDLPAMQPEIIFRYPEKDTKTLELNNLAASICFPTGIKICYEQKNPISIRNYSSQITNQQGDRYYMMTYHFFYKMLNSEFIKTFSLYPLKYQMLKFCDEFLDVIKIDRKTRKKIDQKLEAYEELGFRDLVYVPFCICLISKYPYLKEMEQGLESIRTQLSNYRSSSAEIIKLVSYLTKSIPIPSLNTKLVFGLPHMCQMIELNAPLYKDINCLYKNINCVLSVLSIENIILIFRLMIFEQKILFVDNNYNRLNEISEGFVSLIYPFQ